MSYQNEVSVLKKFWRTKQLCFSSRLIQLLHKPSKFSGESVWQINWIHAQTNKSHTFTNSACTVSFLLMHNHYKYRLLTIQSIRYSQQYYSFTLISFIWKILCTVWTHQFILICTKASLKFYLFFHLCQTLYFCTP